MPRVEDVIYAKENRITAYVSREQVTIHSHHTSINSAHKYGYLPTKFLRAYIISLNGIDYYKVTANSLQEAVIAINQKLGTNPPSPNPSPSPPGQMSLKVRFSVQSVSFDSIRTLVRNGKFKVLNKETKPRTRNSSYNIRQSD